jgi:hypothetical protein
MGFSWSVSSFGVAATGTDTWGKDTAGAARDTLLVPADANAAAATAAAPASVVRRFVDELVVGGDEAARAIVWRSVRSHDPSMEWSVMEF